ncbi:MAG: hydroxyphenylacetyl-CoA thioesterase PaaI [Chromatiales bacterium]|nr:hydroxyphenylacetyl-CoA thioesterase PaaI [Chromatiales bacterium]
MTGELQQQAESIGRWMAEHDRYARLLGMELEAVKLGFCQIGMTVTDDMLNSVGMTHGGVTFGLADFAFAVASNSHGNVAVGLNAQINYPAASQKGDRLTAVAREENKTGRTGLYTIEVRRQTGELVALFTGTVFRRSDTMIDWMNRD